MTKYEGLFGTIDLDPVHQSPSHKRRYKDYGPEWEELAGLCLTRANHICEDCKKAKATNAHHIVPLSKGGANKLHNLRALCFYCHAKYHVHMGRRNTDNQKDIPL
jgi:5-methylcytosine-specific restriction endonuclease McrA